jgi:hypothetical protein
MGAKGVKLRGTGDKGPGVSPTSSLSFPSSGFSPASSLQALGGLHTWMRQGLGFASACLEITDNVRHKRGTLPGGACKRLYPT